MSHASIAVSDASQVAEARRLVTEAAVAAGLGEALRGTAALVATEMATNLVKHAGGGEILAEAGADSIELIALDRGPGMADVNACLRDGFSTAGSPGTGLGAIRRIAAAFDIFSTAGSGAAVLARVGATGPGGHPAVRGISVAMAGERECGDAWAARRDGQITRILAVDGLGHGPQAAEAARAALDVFRRQGAAPPGETLERLHGALKATRGGAAAVLQLNPAAQSASFAGAGNISAAILTGTNLRQMVSHNGIVGHGTPRVQEFVYPWAPDSLAVLHSDGLGTRWSLDPYPGLAARDPALIAAVLYRDFSRGRDDVTVAVAK